MRQKKDFNVPVTVLSGIDGSVQTKTDIYRKEIKSACKHASFVNMATMFFPSCDNVEATTWKRQLGSATRKTVFILAIRTPPPPSIIHPFCNTRGPPGMERQLGSDN